MGKPPVDNKKKIKPSRTWSISSGMSEISKFSIEEDASRRVGLNEVTAGQEVEFGEDGEELVRSQSQVANVTFTTLPGHNKLEASGVFEGKAEVMSSGAEDSKFNSAPKKKKDWK